MGWTFGRDLKSAEDVRARVTDPKEFGGCYKVLAEAWGYDGVDPDGERALFVANEMTELTDRPGEQFISVFLVAPSKNGWGYKDMDESMGPYRNDVPAVVLDALTGKPSQYANMKWRAKARARHGAQLALAV